MISWISLGSAGTFECPLLADYCPLRRAPIDTLASHVYQLNPWWVVPKREHEISRPIAGSFIELASRIGFQVFLAPFSPNGMPLHVEGFLAAFNTAAIRNARKHSLSRWGPAIAA
jgi:hypothetical protein